MRKGKGGKGKMNERGEKDNGRREEKE